MWAGRRAIEGIGYLRVGARRGRVSFAGMGTAAAISGRTLVGGATSPQQRSIMFDAAMITPPAISSPYVSTTTLGSPVPKADESEQ